MTSTMTDRIAYHAVQVQPLRLLLSILAAPFYAVGFLAAVIWFGLAWCYAAVGVGFSDGKRRRNAG